MIMRRMKLIFTIAVSTVLVLVLWLGGGSLIDEEISRSTQFTMKPNINVKVPKLTISSKNGSNSAQVLLLAYFRSGSTFTAEILKQTEGSFYVFEPLHTVYSIYMKKALSPLLLNGTRWPTILEGYQMPFIYNLLDSVLNCEFTKVDRLTLLAYSRKSKLLYDFRECYSKLRSKTDLYRKCIRELTMKCQKAPIRVVKTIRTPMKLVWKLLEKNPSLKVIHLLRDPRGHYQSWFRHDGTRRDPADLVSYLCNRVRADLKERQLLQKKYPENFMEVIYEDLSQNPMAVTRKIYRWLGVDIQPRVISWLYNSTNNSKDGSYVETYRQNSTKTAYSWVSQIKEQQMTLLNIHCADLIRHGNFPELRTVGDIRNFQIPLRSIDGTE